MRVVLMMMVALAFLSTTAAQVTAPMIAKPEDQAVIKPLVVAEKKAREELNAKVAALPEAEALKKAQDALNKAVEALPENKAWKEAGAKTLDTAYKLLAKYQLSSREYRPELNDKGDLVFSPIPKQ